MEVIAVTILLLVSSMLASFYWMLFKSSSSDGLPPGPTVYELLTTIPDTNKEDSAFVYKRLVKLGEKHGGLFTLRALGKKCLIVQDWKIMRDALIGQSEVFAGRPWIYIANHRNTNTDILFADGPLVKEKRRFTMHHLRNLGVGKTSMETIILDETSNLVDTIQRQVGRKLLINGLFFFPVLSILFKIIAGGKKKDDDEAEIQKLGKSMLMMIEQSEVNTELNLFPWLRFLPRYRNHMQLLVSMHDNVVSMLDDIVHDHCDWLATRGGDNDEPRDFMDAYLMEIQRRQTKPEVTATGAYGKDHLIGITYDLLVAATGTTPFTMEWALLYLALWPQIQQKVHDELDQIVGRSRLPNYSDRCLMPYLDATILEIHRYTTVLPLSGLHSTMSATKLEGFVIPRRTTVVQNSWAVHNDPKLWGDPEVFRPERFINADGKVQKPEYLIPFSLGARKCIGESLARVEVFLFLASLLQRFSFDCATGEPLPSLKASSKLTRKMDTTIHLIAKDRR